MIHAGHGDGADRAMREINALLRDQRPVVALGILAGAAGTVAARVPKPLRKHLLTLFASMVRMSVQNAPGPVYPVVQSTLAGRIRSWVRR